MMWLKSFIEGIDFKEFLLEFFGSGSTGNVLAMEKNILQIYTDLATSPDSSLQSWVSNQIVGYQADKSFETNPNELTWALCMGYVHPRDCMIIVVPDMELPEESWITYDDLKFSLPEKKSKAGGIRHITFSDKVSETRRSGHSLKLNPKVKYPTRPGTITPSDFGGDFKTFDEHQMNAMYGTDYEAPKSTVKKSEVLVKVGKLPFLLRDMSLEMLKEQLNKIESPRYKEAIANEINRKSGVKVNSEESGDIEIPKRRSLGERPEVERRIYLDFVKKLNFPSEKEISSLLQKKEEKEMYSQLKKAHKGELKSPSKSKSNPMLIDEDRYEYARRGDGSIAFDGGMPIILREKHGLGGILDVSDFNELEADIHNDEDHSRYDDDED